jgi:hypothetical protein
MAIDLDQRLRQDLLYRLRWDLPGAMEIIEIANRLVRPDCPYGPQGSPSCR